MAVPVRALRRCGVPVLMLCILALGACGETKSDVSAREHARIGQKIDLLAVAIDSGELTKGRLIGHYADRLDKEKPEHRPLVSELRKEATTGGLAFANLKKRFAAIPAEPKNDEEAVRALASLARLEAASDVKVFDDGLTDIVNVLAGLSGGTLPAIEGAAGERAPEAGAAGSYLVGNPAYGQWQQTGSGTSFWTFYGQYALFRDVIGGGSSWTQDRWYRDRGWSYYGEHGRHYYGSPSSQKQWATVAKRNPDVARKTFRSTGSERRLSTYSRTADRKPGTVAKRANAHSGYGASVRGTTTRRSSWGGGK